MWNNHSNISKIVNAREDGSISNPAHQIVAVQELCNYYLFLFVFEYRWIE